VEHDLSPGNYTLTIESDGPDLKLASEVVFSPGVVYFGYRRHPRYGWEQYSWSAADSKGVVTTIDYDSRGLRARPDITLNSLHVESYRALVN